MLSTTTRYYYDGVNEIVETDGSGDKLRYYIHGISYVDERLMMLDYKDTSESDDDRPYYYTLDRMYNVRMVIDRAGAIVERYAYDPYGRPLIREAPARGDMDNDNLVDNADKTRFDSARAGTIWDPRADMDDDGDVDRGQFAQDAQLFNNKHVSSWPPFLPFPPPPNPTVAQAFSDVDNPFMFQGRPHFALDTGASATEGELMINDHRERKRTIGSGGWDTRDPLWYNLTLAIPIVDQDRNSSQTRSASLRRTTTWFSDLGAENNVFRYMASSPVSFVDPSGLCEIALACWPAFGGNLASHCEWVIIDSSGGETGSCHGGATTDSSGYDGNPPLLCCGLYVGSEWKNEPEPSGGNELEFVSAGDYPESVCDCVRHGCGEPQAMCYKPLPLFGSGNSNTQASDMAANCGLPTAPPDVTPPAVGW